MFFVEVCATTYGGTPLIWTPRGQAKLSVLMGCSYWAGSQKKSHGYMFSRREDEGKRFYGNKMLVNCIVTLTDENCELSD